MKQKQRVNLIAKRKPIRLPKISLPRFSLPRFHLPRLRLPKIKVPIIKIPQIGLPQLRLKHAGKISLSIFYLVLLVVVGIKLRPVPVDANQVAQASLKNKKIKILARTFENNKIYGIENLETDQNTGLIKVTLSSDSFFQLGSAQLAQQSQMYLQEIAKVLKVAGEKARVEIEGHTDDVPVVRLKKIYPTNMELSVARATSIEQALEGAGLNKEKLKVAGYGELRPLVPNRDANGTVIAANSAKNRRIILRIYQ